KWIAYASGAIGNEGIWVMRADGSTPTQLTGCKPGDPSTCATDDWAPTWSPNGSQIAFLRVLSETDRPIYIMNADGSDQHRLSRVDRRRRPDVEVIHRWPGWIRAPFPVGKGAPGRTRTADAGLRTASLCPLSYGGAASIVARGLVRADSVTPFRRP